MGEFAQFEKQRALGLLQRRLVSLDLPSAQYDFQHRLLAFLYSAADAPLDSQYEGGILVDRLQQEAQSASRPVCWTTRAERQLVLLVTQQVSGCKGPVQCVLTTNKLPNCGILPCGPCCSQTVSFTCSPGPANLPVRQHAQWVVGFWQPAAAAQRR